MEALQYLTRTVDYVHLKIRPADVKTNCSLFCIGNLDRHNGSCFTPKLGVCYLWWDKANIAMRRCWVCCPVRARLGTGASARAQCPSHVALPTPLPREWRGKSMEPAGLGNGDGSWGLSTCWIGPDEGERSVGSVMTLQQESSCEM